MLCKFILSPDEPSLSTCLVLGSESTGIITMTTPTLRSAWPLGPTSDVSVSDSGSSQRGHRS